MTVLNRIAYTAPLFWKAMAAIGGRQREHDVEIGNRQQFGLPIGQPLRPCGPLTLWTMPIAARVVGDARRAASSQASTWPPSAAVRHAVIALMTRRSVRPHVRRGREDRPRHDDAGYPRLRLSVGRRKPRRGPSPAPAARLSRRHDLQRQSVERAPRRPDRVGRDLRIARRRRQIVMTEQNLNDPDVGSAFQEMRREAMAQRVNVTRLVKPAALTADRQAACKTGGSMG